MVKPPKKSAKLTKKHEIFVAEYLACLDATKAALAAGYSPKSAQSQGCQLLKHPKISAEITKQTEKRLGKLGYTADDVLREIAKLAFLDPRKFFNEDGSLKGVQELDDQTAVCIAGIDVEELFAGRGKDKSQVGELKKLKFVDKGINLERLGKNLKLFTDKVEATGEGGGPIIFKLQRIGQEAK